MEMKFCMSARTSLEDKVVGCLTSDFSHSYLAYLLPGNVDYQYAALFQFTLAI